MTWAWIVVAVVVLLVVLREVLRWHGGRWRRNGPRGDQH